MANYVIFLGGTDQNCFSMHCTVSCACKLLCAAPLSLLHGCASNCIMLLVYSISDMHSYIHIFQKYKLFSSFTLLMISFFDLKRMKRTQVLLKFVSMITEIKTKKWIVFAAWILKPQSNKPSGFFFYYYYFCYQNSMTKMYTETLIKLSQVRLHLANSADCANHTCHHP